jgi:hypothetical protein
LASAVGFDVPATLLGNSTWTGQDGKPVSIYYDPADANAKGMAADTLARIETLMAWCDQLFQIKGGGGNILFSSKVGGGAYHYGCGFNSQGQGFSDWYETNEGTVPASPSTSPGGAYFGLVMAEVSESYMGLQGKGWNCGGSGGEGLSRVLAEIVSGGPDGALSTYMSGPSWDGMDWISRDQGTDQDYPSIGCSVLYLYWMLFLGFSIDQIIQAGEPDGSLASNYQTLTGRPKSGAFTAFQAACRLVGAPGAIRSDNPFGAPVPVYPPTSPPNPNPNPQPIPPLKIITTSLPSGIVNQPYAGAASLSASGGVPPYSWTASNLPFGLSLAASGFITGTPTVPGSFSVVISVLDSVNTKAGVTLSMTINPAAPNPNPNPGPGQTVQQIVDAMFAALEAKSGLLLRLFLQAIQRMVDLYFLANPPIAGETVRQAVDAAFKFIEGKINNPIFTAILSAINAMVDAWLTANGY